MAQRDPTLARVIIPLGECLAGEFIERANAIHPEKGRSWWNGVTNTLGEVAWIAASNRYFTTALHLPLNRREKRVLTHSRCRSRHGEPVRTIHSTPSTNILFPRPADPFWSGRPMINGALRSHAASLSTMGTALDYRSCEHRHPTR